MKNTRTMPAGRRAVSTSRGKSRAGASKAPANAPEPVAPPSTPREREVYELGKREGEAAGEAAALRMVGRGALWIGEKMLGALFNPYVVCGAPVRGKMPLTCVLKKSHDGDCSTVIPQSPPPPPLPGAVPGMRNWSDY